MNQEVVNWIRELKKVARTACAKIPGRNYSCQCLASCVLHNNLGDILPSLALTLRPRRLRGFIEISFPLRSTKLAPAALSLTRYIPGVHEQSAILRKQSFIRLIDDIYAVIVLIPNDLLLKFYTLSQFGIMSAGMFIFGYNSVKPQCKAGSFGMEKAGVYWSLFRSPNPQLPLWNDRI